jgi:putative iron-only hydrogenase system regulator
MERRIGFVGIILEHRDSVEAVNHALSEHAELVLARMGLPRRDRGLSVITLVVEASTDELGMLTGRLGAIPGVSVKSALAKQGKTGG